MLLGFPENFSENGARPVQFLGRNGRLIGWARSFSDFMTVTDNTIVGGRSLERQTRIAGRDVRQPDGHTVGKTFSRKELLGSAWQLSPARSAESASNHRAAYSRDSRRTVDPIRLLRHKASCLQNGARETGLGHKLPGFLRSNQSVKLNPPPRHVPRKLSETQQRS
jgi:hypothetical protein